MPTASTRTGAVRGRLVPLLVTALVVTTMTLAPTATRAAEPNQVTDLAAVQHDGFTTLSWTPVAGATDYQVERTPANDDDVTTGAAVISGLWRPNRQVHNESPTFADAGYAPGSRFRWRVRARFGTTAQPYSEPLFRTTLASFGPTEFLTQFETTGGAQFTSYANEIDWTRRIADASDRVRVVTLGFTAQGREINLFIIGYPAPLATAAEISASPTSGANCNVHGNEPTGREGCFMMIRQLAFSDDPWVIDILSHGTVLIVPSINGDGRNSNVRGNSTGQDLNRDHGRLTQPETRVFAEFIRDYTPEVMVDGHEFGDNNTCDLPLLWPRHSNTAEAVHNESKRMVESPMYEAAAVDGWWPCPYPLPGIDGAQSFTRVTGLKNMIVTLVEARSAGGTTRPNESNTQNNRRRKAYSHLWLIRIALDYHRANLAEIQTAIQAGIDFQSSNTGRVVFHGDWDVAAFPAPHPGDNPPPNNAPGPSQILDPPPCAYRISEALYSTPLTDSGSLPVAQRTTAAQRLAAHGVVVQDRPAGHIVRMAQPLRGLINIVLDGQTPPAPIVAAERIYECPHATASADDLSLDVVEGATATASITIGNIAPEADQPLNWTITEAASSCASPSDLDWLATSAAAGTVSSGASESMTVTFDATALTAPDAFSGLLCLTSNDPGEPVIALPVSLQVQYPFVGFLSPIGSVVNIASAGSNVPVKFRVGGQRTSAVLTAGSPVSYAVDCTSLDQIGGAQPTSSGSGLVWSTDKYQYDWKTQKSWNGTCRRLVISLDDGTVHDATFHFPS